MLELIRSTLLAGLGASVITKDKAEEAVQGLVAQGKLTADEAKQLVGKLLASGGQQWEEVQNGLNDALRKALDSADVARAKEVEIIAQRLKSAEQRIAMLEDTVARLAEPDRS